MNPRTAILLLWLGTLAGGSLPLLSQSVLITEFMADNETGLRDEDGDNSDWVELFNAGTNAVDLFGWYLTDSRANLVKWRFPSTNLPPNGFLVVFASDKDRAVPGRPLHTSFGLSADGEYLGLVQPDGLTIASEFAPTYPPQAANASFGLPMTGFLVLTSAPASLTPTPGTNNGGALSFPGPVISDVLHSPTVPQDEEDLVISARVAPLFAPVGGVTLYYRVMFEAEVSVPMFDDGAHNDADAGDGIYGAIIPASASTNGQMVRWFIRAADTGAGVSRYPPFLSPTDSEQYLGTVVQEPTLSNPAPVLHWFIPPGASAQLDFGSAAARCSLYWKGELYDNIRFSRRGQASTGFRKKSYNVDFNPDHHFLWADGEKRVGDINWLTTYTDKTHMRNMLAYGVHKDAGPRSPSQFVVPVRVQSNSVFYGTVHLVEDVDDDYLERIGRDKAGALYEMEVPPTDPAVAVKKTRQSEDRSDLREFINRATAAATNRAWIYDNVDVSESINFFAAMIVTANVVCCHENFYLYRDSDGDREWEILPEDVDLSFGRNWSSSQSYWMDDIVPNNPLFVGGTFPLGPTLWNVGTTTREMYLRRVRTLQDKLLQPNGTPVNELNFEKQVDDWTALLAPDALLDLQKWGTWGGGQPNLFPGSLLYTQYVRTLPEAAAQLKTNYLPNRRAFVFGQKMNLPAEFPDAQPANVVVLLGTIEYNPSSGNQSEEYIQLINTNSYAVDISGWRLSGAVAHTFQGGVVIPRAGSSNTLYVVPDKLAFRRRASGPRGGIGLYVEGPYAGRLSARGGTVILADDRGRIVQTNRFVGDASLPQQYLRITEIMYHPTRPLSGGPDANEELEFIELMNVGPATLDLTGVRLTNGVFFSFTGAAISNLGPGQRVVLVKNLETFRSVYGANVPVAGVFTGGLDNEAGGFRLEDAQGETILEVFYDNAWYPMTDGVGFSLVIVDENADPDSWSSRVNWRASSWSGGSPGAADPPPTVVPGILVNEVLSNAEAPFEDAVELYNPTSMEVDVSGWWLTDDFNTPKKFRIPDGTFIPAGGFLAFDEHSFNLGTSAGSQSFSFKNDGDDAYLFAGDESGNVLGYAHGFKFGAADPNVTLGRHVDRIGREHFVAQAGYTMSEPNTGPRVGPVVISEIMYHPQGILSGGVWTENTSDEYLELHNITDQPVPLYYTNFTTTNAWLATNTWRLDKGVNFGFPTGVILPPHGLALVVNFDPRRDPNALARFREKYGVPSEVPVLGPHDQKLSNDGEPLELYKPGQPASGAVPYVLVDRVEYSSSLPWPRGPDRIGASLQRVNLHAFGDDPSNWIGVGPSAGSVYVSGGVAPSIITPPANTTAIIGRTAMFSVDVTGTPPLFYQWRFNGLNLANAHRPVLTLTNLQTRQAGHYSVLVYNTAGFVESSNALLSLLLPPSIVQQPTGQAVYIKPDARAANLPDGTNVTFTILGDSGNSAVTYQWRFNGVNMPGATNTSLIISNVQLAHEGDYSCAVSDTFATTISVNARLVPLLQPVLVRAPANQTLAAGSDFTASVEVTGHPLPIAYSWRRGSAIIASNYGNFRSSFITLNTTTSGLVLTNNILSSNFVMRVVAYNEANHQPGVLLASFTNTILADLDRDGIPDVVEQGLGLSTNNASDAALDADGDGMSNRDEYIAGTDPTNHLSYLKVDRLNTSGTARIEFLAVSNRTYAVEAAGELPGGPWTRVAEVVASATNRLVEVLDPASSTGSVQRVYRLVTPRTP